MPPTEPVATPQPSAAAPAPDARFVRPLSTLSGSVPPPAAAPQAAPAPGPAPKRRKGVLIGAIVGGLVGSIIAAGSIVFFLAGRAHHYTQFKPATVGQTSGSRATFVYPAQMTVVSNTQDTGIFADYVGDSKTVYAELNVDSTPVGNLTPATVAAFKDIMKNKKDGYQQTIEGFASQTGGEASNLTFGKFTDFTDSSVKDGLKAEFTYTSKTSGKTGKGELIFAFGKDRLYGMVILAEESVWNNNADAWSKISNSLAIDQK